MKQITLLIGIMLALVVCITPVAAVTGDDFEVVIWEDFEVVTWEEGTWKVDSYIYLNTNDPDEQYIGIYTPGTQYLHSLVTFTPANIPDAPVMVVDTYYMAIICLPQSVDEWEIKFYSSFEPLLYPDPDYLKKGGVVNLKKFFGKQIEDGLFLELDWWQHIHSLKQFNPCYTIPDVD